MIRLPSWPQAARLGLWLAALAVSAMGMTGCAREPVPARSLVVVSLDTTRADHLSLYGHDRETSPVLDALAERSTVFTRAFVQDTNTNPSHASMFTGLYPHVHGAVANGKVLPGGVTTLAEILQERGFHTGGFVSGFTLVSDVSGLERGFQVYDDEMDEEGFRRAGPWTTEKAVAWLRSLPEGSRYFLFFHLFDAHGPYAPSPENLARFRSPDPGPRLEAFPTYKALRDESGHLIRHASPYVDRYDGAIRTNDDQLGRLLQEIDLRETVVLVLADHGETLTERYWALSHGGQVFDEQIRVPMVLHLPGRTPSTVDELVETVDLVPTFLAALGVEPPPALPGQERSLLPLLDGDADAKGSGRRAVFSAARPDSKRFRNRGWELDGSRRIYTVREERWKLIRYPEAGGGAIEELYDLAADPGERSPVEEEPEVRRRLGRLLDRWLALGQTDFRPPDLTPEERKKLEALGYL